MSSNRRAFLAALGCALLLLRPSAAGAAEIRVLCSNGLKAVMDALVPEFERTTGHQVHVTFELAARIRQQIDAGAAFDVAVMTPPLVDDAIMRGHIAAATRAVIARSPLGLFVRTGSRKADLASVESLRRTLLDARSLTYAKEGASGIYFAALLEKLSLAAAMRSKTTLAGSGEEVGELVSSGKVEIGVLPLSEILPVRGTQLLGLLPSEVQSYIVMVAGVGSKSNEAAAAKALIDFLMAPANTGIVTRLGMERTG
jgi:molybdate transport system substrate-binding protein